MGIQEDLMRSTDSFRWIDSRGPHAKKRRGALSAAALCGARHQFRFRHSANVCNSLHFFPDRKHFKFSIEKRAFFTISVIEQISRHEVFLLSYVSILFPEESNAGVQPKKE